MGRMKRECFTEFLDQLPLAGHILACLSVGVQQPASLLAEELGVPEDDIIRAIHAIRNIKPNNPLGVKGTKNQGYVWYTQPQWVSTLERWYQKQDALCAGA